MSSNFINGYCRFVWRFEHVLVNVFESFDVTGDFDVYVSSVFQQQERTVRNNPVV
jgi:hypothetical protein